jgi:hypothetical protein
MQEVYLFLGTIINPAMFARSILADIGHVPIPQVA